MFRYINNNKKFNIINNILLHNNNNNGSRFNINRNYCKGLSNGNIFEEGKGDLSKVYSVDGYSESGFSVNKILIPGSINIMPQQIFLWDVHSVSDITIDTFATLDIVEPPAEFLLIGTGSTNVKLPDDLIKEISNRYKLNVETMTTMNAIGTYNILAEEERRVAAFILPHVPLSSNEIKEPFLVSKLEYQDIINSNGNNNVNINSNAIKQQSFASSLENQNIILSRKKQTLLKMKLDEVDSKSISMMEKEIEKLEKQINELSSTSSTTDDQPQKKRTFEKMYIPTRNTEEGFVSTNQSQGEEHIQKQKEMYKLTNPLEKSSIIDKMIIWFVKIFGQKK